MELEYDVHSSYSRGSDREDSTSRALPVDIPTNTTSQSYSGSNPRGDHIPFPSDLHGSLHSSTLSSTGDNFGRSRQLGMANDTRHASSEDLSHTSGGATPIQMMGATGPMRDPKKWQAQNFRSSRSRGSNSPLLDGRIYHSRTDSDIAFNSADRRGQRQHEGQEAYNSSANTSVSNIHDYMNHTGSSESDRSMISVLATSHHQQGKRSSAGRSSPSSVSLSSMSTSPSISHIEQHNFIGRKEDVFVNQVKGHHRNTTPVYDQQTPPQHLPAYNLHSHDNYSPGVVRPLYPQQSAPMGVDQSPNRQSYDSFHGLNHRGYPGPSPERGGVLQDKSQHAVQFKRRSTWMNNRESSHSHNKIPSRYGQLSPQGPATNMGVVGVRPGYSDYHGNFRGSQGMLNQPHDPYYGSPVHLPRVSQGGPGTRPHTYQMGHAGMDDDYNSQVAMEMVLSQPTNSYIGYERYGTPLGHPTMGFGISG